MRRSFLPPRLQWAVRAEVNGPLSSSHNRRQVRWNSALQHIPPIGSPIKKEGKGDTEEGGEETGIRKEKSEGLECSFYDVQ